MAEGEARQPSRSQLAKRILWGSASLVRTRDESMDQETADPPEPHLFTFEDADQ